MARQLKIESNHVFCVLLWSLTFLAKFGGVKIFSGVQVDAHTCIIFPADSRVGDRLTIVDVFSGSAVIGSNAVAIIYGDHRDTAIHPRLVHTKFNCVSCRCYNLDSVLRKRHIHSDGSIKFWTDLCEAIRWRWYSWGFRHCDGLTRIITRQFEIECNDTDIVLFRSLTSLALLLHKIE